MNRTQIYLTTDQSERVAQVAANSGRKQSEVIREALDQYLRLTGTKSRLAQLRKGRGLWKGRRDLDLRQIREDVDRFEDVVIPYQK